MMIIFLVQFQIVSRKKLHFASCIFCTKILSSTPYIILKLFRFAFFSWMVRALCRKATNNVEAYDNFERE